MPPVTKEVYETILIRVTMQMGRCLESELEEDALDDLQSIFGRTVGRAVTMNDGAEWWAGDLGLDAKDYVDHVIRKFCTEVNALVDPHGKTGGAHLEQGLEITVNKILPAIQRKYEGLSIDLRTRVCP